MSAEYYPVQMLTARDIMAKKLKVLAPETPIPEAIHAMLTRGYSGMPIADASGEYRGVFSEKCCMNVLASLVDRVDGVTEHAPTAEYMMVPRQKLFTLKPKADVFQAVEVLLNRRYSGAPVIDEDENFFGVFSEKTCMSLVIKAAYDSLPTAEVRGFLNTDQDRLIEPSADLYEIARIFRETPYRRLPVVRDGKIIGQISRRDVIDDSRILTTIMRRQLEDSPGNNRPMTMESGIIMAAHDTLPDHTVAAFADEDAKTITPDLDLFSIAQMFLDTPYRRFPVVEANGQLVGQVSRCDLLKAAFGLLEKAPKEKRGAQSLYLSGIHTE